MYRIAFFTKNYSQMIISERYDRVGTLHGSEVLIYDAS